MQHGSFVEKCFSFYYRGHSKTTLTKFCPILTTYLPSVDFSWHFSYHLPNVNDDISNTNSSPKSQLISMETTNIMFPLKKFTFKWQSKCYVQQSYYLPTIIFLCKTFEVTPSINSTSMNTLGCLKMSTLTLAKPCTYLQLTLVDIW